MKVMNRWGGERGGSEEVVHYWAAFCQCIHHRQVWQQWHMAAMLQSCAEG